ncbi:MAG: ATP-binding protein [Cyanobacteria bacterium P01_D01_bin.56]
MSSFSSALSYQNIPYPVFEQLLRSFSELPAAVTLSERDFDQRPENAEVERFTLLATEQGYLLLLGQGSPGDIYRACLCTEPDIIGQFLALPWLKKNLSPGGQTIWGELHRRVSTTSSSMQDVLPILPFDHPSLLQWLHRLVFSASGLERWEQPPTAVSSAAILQRIVERLNQPEQSFGLFIQATLDEVCLWLRLDRLFIFQTIDTWQFSPQADVEHFSVPEDNQSFVPHVAYEALGCPSTTSILRQSDSHCDQNSSWHQRYTKDGELYYAIEDVAAHYQQFPCLVERLKQAQVDSQVVVPLWLNNHLWGLLIGHRCMGGQPQESHRHWQPWEGQFLSQVATHIAIALRQTDLQHQLYNQKLMLKSQVDDRTQNLKDALMAAEAANKTKSEFLATMSHELRTPLTYIIGMSATLLRWSFGELSPRQRDYLNTIHSSGEQLLDIINDILDVAKIEAGRTVLEVNDFSLSNLARSSLESFRGEAQAKGVDLRINLRLSETEDSFRADPRRIRQILANLLSNAIKFTDANGRISLRVWRDPHNVMFQVEDTGIGIPEAQQAILFEKFKQLETARQRQYPGTGLGLALTKQLVELHSGSIQVVSTPGKGSMFTVRIPMQHPDGLANAFQTVEPTTGRIILLEDDENSASLICDLLTAADYQVIWVIEGSRIVHQVEILQPVAIILNQHLVSGNSQYIVDDLKRYVATSSIKVISLVEEDGAELGYGPSMEDFDDCLVKPINPPTLLNTIQKLTQH